MSELDQTEVSERLNSWESRIDYNIGVCMASHHALIGVFTVLKTVVSSDSLAAVADALEHSAHEHEPKSTPDDYVPDLTVLGYRDTINGLIETARQKLK